MLDALPMLFSAMHSIFSPLSLSLTFSVEIVFPKKTTFFKSSRDLFLFLEFQVFNLALYFQASALHAGARMLPVTFQCDVSSSVLFGLKSLHEN